MRSLDSSTSIWQVRTQVLDKVISEQNLHKINRDIVFPLKNVGLWTSDKYEDEYKSYRWRVQIWERIIKLFKAIYWRRDSNKQAASLQHVELPLELIRKNHAVRNNQNSWLYHSSKILTLLTDFLSLNIDY